MATGWSNEGARRRLESLAALIEAERGCCPFPDFTLGREEDEVRVAVGLAPEAKATAVQLGIVAEGS
jgi:hypothetical protein